MIYLAECRQRVDASRNRRHIRHIGQDTESKYPHLDGIAKAASVNGLFSYRRVVLYRISEVATYGDIHIRSAAIGVARVE
jgi:hypothetical protein